MKNLFLPILLVSSFISCIETPKIDIALSMNIHDFQLRMFLLSAEYAVKKASKKFNVTVYELTTEEQISYAEKKAFKTYMKIITSNAEKWKEASEAVKEAIYKFARKNYKEQFPKESSEANYLDSAHFKEFIDQEIKRLYQLLIAPKDFDSLREIINQQPDQQG